MCGKYFLIISLSLVIYLVNSFSEKLQDSLLSHATKPDFEKLIVCDDDTASNNQLQAYSGTKPIKDEEIDVSSIKGDKNEFIYDWKDITHDFFESIKGKMYTRS